MHSDMHKLIAQPIDPLSFIKTPLRLPTETRDVITLGISVLRNPEKVGASSAGAYISRCVLSAKACGSIVEDSKIWP
jgi:hypothetical protein